MALFRCALRFLALYTPISRANVQRARIKADNHKSKATRFCMLAKSLLACITTRFKAAIEETYVSSWTVCACAHTYARLPFKPLRQKFAPSVLRGSGSDILSPKVGVFPIERNKIRISENWIFATYKLKKNLLKNKLPKTSSKFCKKKRELCKPVGLRVSGLRSPPLVYD